MNDLPPEKKFSERLVHGVFMLLFCFVGNIAGVLVGWVALFQFACALIVRRPNQNAQGFGKVLGCYLKHIVEFLSYTTDEKPWPFAPWPQTTDGA